MPCALHPGRLRVPAGALVRPARDRGLCCDRIAADVETEEVPVMRRIDVRWALLVALCFGFARTAEAVTIGFVPSAAAAGVGDTVLVDLVVTGLAGELVAGWEAQVAFDPALAAGDVASLTLALGDPDAFEVLEDVDLGTSGIVGLAQASLLANSGLVALQNGISLTLATLSFETLAPGVLNLGFASGAPLEVVGIGGLLLPLGASSASVVITPEPTLASLLACGVLAWIGASVGRRRRRA
ncbi:MAG: hypothetical protein HKP30_04875 [Myxococcales bacterium]|nr:hypothetical protein [Myxococcales bacterium]